MDFNDRRKTFESELAINGDSIDYEEICGAEEC